MRDYGNTNAAPYASAPAVGLTGDTYWNTTEQALYVSTGTAWLKAGPGMWIGATAPTTPTVGQLWWRTDPDQTLYVYYDDGNTKQWVSATPVEQMWQTVGATLTPVDATKIIAIPGDTAGGNAIVFGPTSIVSRGRLAHHQTAQSLYLSENIALTGVGTWAQDDISKPSWQLLLNPSGDNAAFRRTPAGSTTFTNLLTLDSTGNLTLPGTTHKVSARTMLYADAGTTEVYHNLSGVPQYDQAAAGWMYRIGSSIDSYKIARRAAATTTFVDLLTLDATGILSTGKLVATSNAGTQLTIGSPIVSALDCSQAGMAMTINHPWGPQDATKPSLLMQFDISVGADALHLYRRAPNAATGTVVEVFKINGATSPPGDLSITGNNATKATGASWINPSDPRLKNDIAPYAAGLAEICRLDPITYRLKAHPELLCYGFDASAVREVLPECVSTTKMKLDPADEEETEDVLTFDMHPILVALVNTVKELAAKVAALEAKVDGRS